MVLTLPLILWVFRVKSAPKLDKKSEKTGNLVVLSFSAVFLEIASFAEIHGKEYNYDSGTIIYWGPCL